MDAPPGSRPAPPKAKATRRSDLPGCSRRSSHLLYSWVSSLEREANYASWRRSALLALAVRARCSRSLPSAFVCTFLALCAVLVNRPAQGSPSRTVYEILG